MSRLIGREQCPSCAEKGGDNSRDNLAVYSDGSKHCHVCSYHENKGKGKMSTYRPPSHQGSLEDVTMVGSYPIKSSPDRNIEEAVNKFYGVRCSINESNGQQDKRYYPYTDSFGTISGYKVRKFPKDFTAVGKVKGLFGQHCFKEGGKLLIIFEGEEDALAGFQMLKLSGKQYACVSIPNGANEDGVVDKQTQAQLEYMSSFENVMLCFDKDKPGEETAKQLADLLCSQTNVKMLVLPDEYKDASDMCKANKAQEFYKCINNAKDYRPEQIVEGKDLDFKSLRVAKERGFDLPYPELQNKLKGVRRGELMLVCAGSGIGKSLFTREIGFHLWKQHGLKIGNILLETPMEDAVNAFIAMECGVHPAKYLYNPDIVEEVVAEKAFDTIKESMVFFKHFGSINPKVLVNKINYMKKVLGVDFVILDHLSMVVSGNESDNERKDLDVIMTDLAKLCVSTGIGIIAVVHLKRVPGKNYNTGDEVELTDLRGSAGLEQMSWSVVALERDQQGETKDFSQVRVLKNRTWGFTGVCDRLRYDHEAGRLLEVETQEY